MNAFFIFCKRHRDVVKEKYPHLENRSITKILGEWWVNLEAHEKTIYIDLAKQYKEAFMKANPDFKWYKMPAASAPPMRPLLTRPTNHRPTNIKEDPLPSPTKAPEENSQGGNGERVTPPAPLPIPYSLPNSSKPPKKRYLENGEFKNQNDIAPPPPPPPPPPKSNSNTKEACTALLELAEMCSNKEVQKRCGPSTTASASTPTKPTPPAPRAILTPIPVFDVDIANRFIDHAFSQPQSTPTISSSMFTSPVSNLISTSVLTTRTSEILPLPPPPPPPPPRPAANSILVQSPQQEHPLNLCKETTITASNQQIINHMIVKLMSGPPDPPHSSSSSSSLAKFSHVAKLPLVRTELFSKPAPAPKSLPLVEYEVKRDSPSPQENSSGRDESSVGSPLGHRSICASPSKKTTIPHSPVSSRDSYEGDLESGGQPRKSQRTCKGKRYIALMTEGVLQPAKERKMAITTRKSSISEDKPDVDAASGSLENCNKKGLVRKRTDSMDSPVSDREEPSKKNSKPSPAAFDLDEQIAALPKCSMDALLTKKKRVDGDTGFACQDDRFHSDTDPAKDPDFRPSSGVSRRLHPSLPSLGAKRGATPHKRYKTGDFDLEAHIAALPRCDIEALSKKHNNKQPNSGDSKPDVNNSPATSDKESLNEDTDTDCYEHQEEGSSQDKLPSSQGPSGSLVGSRKRKPRKKSITHLNPENPQLVDNLTVFADLALLNK